jgi:hypothetical protein
MKKFFLYTFYGLVVLGTLFTYILYTEGFFESKPKSTELKPFEMKCEAGKCAVGKCANAK